MNSTDKERLDKAADMARERVSKMSQSKREELLRHALRHSAESLTGLLPCPFCGCSEVTGFYSGSSDWDFDCKGCKASVTFWIRGGNESEGARLAWNRRGGKYPTASDPKGAESVHDGTATGALPLSKTSSEEE